MTGSPHQTILVIDDNKNIDQSFIVTMVGVGCKYMAEGAGEA